MNIGERSSLRIETPEGVVFSFVLATPVIRALAWAVDAALVMTASSIVGYASSALRVLSPDAAQALSALLYFGVSIGYGIAFEWHWRGQTVGKRLLGLRVVDAQGLRLQLSQIVLRNLFRAADILPLCYLVGGTACLLSRKAQRLGDLAANTIVLRERKLLEPDVDEIASAKYNSLAALPHLALRLRSRVPPEAAAIAITALTLRDGYTPAARAALFCELAAYLKSLAEFPAEVVEALTDEQYVRSAVRVIYGQK